VKDVEEDVIFHKDLREVEFVTGENTGRLAAPIYGQFQIDEMLVDYVAPDGVTVNHGFLGGGYLGPPEDSRKSAVEWTGEWTVTYETFRDMGGAFMLAMIIIYMLVVIEFKNFIFPSIIMAPIPLTLVGIIPGHWFFGAEFTATSMIGWIALAGIIVRNSILLVDFTKHEVEQGVPVMDAVINSCQARTRPIVITALALVGGSSVILTDPIFEGMAISLLFGVVVSTVLTLFVIPLGCISAKRAFPGCAEIDYEEDEGAAEETFKVPMWMRLYGGIVAVVGWIFAIFQMVFNLLRMVIGMVFPAKLEPPTPPATPPPVARPPAAPAPVPPAAAPVDASAASDISAEKSVAANTDETVAVKKTVAAVKKVPVKKAAVKKAPEKKVAVKKAPEKKVAVKKTPEKKTVAVKKKAAAKSVPVKKTPVKKAPSKKTSPGGRRGIRLKDDGE